MSNEATYNYKVVRQFAIMTVVWGVVGMLVGVIIAAQLLWPELNLGVPWLSYGRLRPLHTNAVIFAFGGCALFATSYYVVQRTCHARIFSRRPRRLHLLGLAGGDRARRDHAAARHHFLQGVRRARVADRHPDRAGVGGLRLRVLRHAVEAQGPAHLRRQLVLRRLHPDGGAAAHRQQRRHAGHLLEVLLRLRRRAGRDGAVVVRAQRGRLLPHRGLPRDDVLLHPEAGRAPDLLLPPVGGALLGADLHLHVGGPAPPALHGAARLGAVARHGVLADPARALLGRDDQRHHDALGRVAQTARRPDPQVPHRVAVVLRHVHLRGPDDVDQDGQRALALHRLDHRPRAQRRARLGGPGVDGLDLLPRSRSSSAAPRCGACA